MPAFLQNAFTNALAGSGVGGSDTSITTFASLAGLAAVVVLVVCTLIWHDRPIGVRPQPGMAKLTPAYPLVGNLPFFLSMAGSKTGMLDFMLEMQRTFGKGGKPFTVTAPIPAFGGRSIFINRPEYIQYVQKTNFPNFDKGKQFQNNFDDLLSRHGIFAADGDIWKRQRKMASNIFSVSNFRTHVQRTVQHHLETMQQLAADCSKKQVEVNLPDLMFRFTLDTFAVMSFNANLECLPTDSQHLDKEVPFATAFDFAQTVVNERFVDPFWRIREFFGADGRRMRKSINSLRSICFGMIDQRFAAKASGEQSGAVDSKEGKDLLQLFMDQGLSRDELLPVVLNFIIAGRDTTAQALSWAFLELHRHPDIVRKIREEAKEVLADGRLMEYDDLKAMPYTNAVFYETLRLHPSVPKNIKVVRVDDVIRPYAQELDASNDEKKELMQTERLPDIPVQKGTTVSWSDWAMGRMPEIWGEDCCEFKPDRFLKEDGSLKTYSQYKFHAFNAGPRLCLGQTLATYEGVAMLVLLLSKYDIVLDDAKLKKDPPVYAESLTLPILNPYNARFRAL